MENSRYLFYSRGETNSIIINFTTIADNLIDNIFGLRYNNSFPQTLYVYNSIIDNIGSQIVNTFGSDGDHFAHFANIECSLLHDLSTGGIEDENTQVADPMFVDGYKLGDNSPAIDANCSNNNLPIYYDIVGNDRLSDAIFANGF